MNTKYYKFLELEVTHSYFPLGVSSEFKLLPLSDSARKLQNYNIIINQQNNLFSFYCGTADEDTFDLAAELAQLDTLHFQLIHGDILFKNYTADTHLNNNDILYLKNSPGKDELQADHAPPNDDIPLNTLGVLLLDIQAIINENDPEKKLKLSFNTRELLWQYQLILSEHLKINEGDISIEGIQDETYDGPVKKPFFNHDSALVMTSSIPLPFKQKISENPLLKIKYTDTRTNVTKDLELKLPNQNPQSIKTEEKNGAIIPYLVTTIIYV
jgi:hypothetical protein